MKPGMSIPKICCSKSFCSCGIFTTPYFSNALQNNFLFNCFLIKRAVADAFRRLSTKASQMLSNTNESLKDETRQLLLCDGLLVTLHTCCVYACNICGFCSVMVY